MNSINNTPINITSSKSSDSIDFDNNLINEETCFIALNNINTNINDLANTTTLLQKNFYILNSENEIETDILVNQDTLYSIDDKNNDLVDELLEVEDELLFDILEVPAEEETEEVGDFFFLMNETIDYEDVKPTENLSLSELISMANSPQKIVKAADILKSLETFYVEFEGKYSLLIDAEKSTIYNSTNIGKKNSEGHFESLSKSEVQNLKPLLLRYLAIRIYNPKFITRFILELYRQEKKQFKENQATENTNEAREPNRSTPSISSLRTSFIAVLRNTVVKGLLLVSFTVSQRSLEELRIRERREKEKEDQQRIREYDVKVDERKGFEMRQQNIKELGNWHFTQQRRKSPYIHRNGRG